MVRDWLLRFALSPTCLLPATAVEADEWPQWRGPGRDAIWREEGLVETLPEGQLEPTWSIPCGLGYAGPAVAGSRVYLFEYDHTSGKITDNAGARDKLEGKERLRCLVAETGEEIWRYEYDRPYNLSYPSGPRCTPTVDGDRVYILGAEGDLTCLSISDGSVVWKKNFPEDYNAPTPIWGHAAHPVVHGETLYCMVGGEGSVVVAFDKMTGDEKWKALSTPSIGNECGYCPPSIIRRGGDYELLVFHPEGVAGLDPETGEQQWSVPLEPSYGMSIAQPIKLPPQVSPPGAIFATGYGGPSVLFALPENGKEPKVFWSGTPKTSVSSANATPMPAAMGPVLYGVDANSSSLCAVNTLTGERLWQTQKPTLGKDDGRSRDRHGTTFIVRQGDTTRFWLASETGDLILAKLTPEAYEELGRAKLLEPTGDAFGRPVLWSHPAFADKAVFARNDKELVRVNLAAE